MTNLYHPRNKMNNHIVPISKIHVSPTDTGAERAVVSSGGGPHQTDKRAHSLSDAVDWSLHCAGDTSCADTLWGISGQSSKESEANTTCCCCERDNSGGLVGITSVDVVDRTVKLPDRLRGTDVADIDGPFDSLLPRLDMFVGNSDLEINASSHRLHNSDADRVGNDTGLGGSLKNVLRLSRTEAAISPVATRGFPSGTTSGKSKDVVPLSNVVLTSGGVLVVTGDVVTGRDGTVVVRHCALAWSGSNANVALVDESPARPAIPRLPYDSCRVLTKLYGTARRLASSCNTEPTGWAVFAWLSIWTKSVPSDVCCSSEVCLETLCTSVLSEQHLSGATLLANGPDASCRLSWLVADTRVCWTSKEDLVGEQFPFVTVSSSAAQLCSAAPTDSERSISSPTLHSSK